MPLFAAYGARRRRRGHVDAIESSQSPSRMKMCDGMCSACGDDGAIFE